MNRIFLRTCKDKYEGKKNNKGSCAAKGEGKLFNSAHRKLKCLIIISHVKHLEKHKN